MQKVVLRAKSCVACNKAVCNDVAFNKVVPCMLGFRELQLAKMFTHDKQFGSTDLCGGSAQLDQREEKQAVKVAIELVEMLIPICHTSGEL